MPLLIGIDEAGLGPNLGPLVVAATVWEVPGPPADADFWGTFADVLTNSPTRNDRRLHVADSKAVYKPPRELGPLEQSVQTLLRLGGVEAGTLGTLISALLPSAEEFPQSSPWSQTAAPVPAAWVPDVDAELLQQWRDTCGETGWRLKRVCAAVVIPEEFNRRIARWENKSSASSEVHFEVLRSVWPRDGREPALVVSDKHGGRNRYGDLLTDLADGELVTCLRESATCSEYRLGKSTFRFQPRAEEHGPVALASMVAKYLRELAMHQFNGFWKQYVPDLKPTQGYPVDAQRFRRDIAAAQATLGISDDVLWRCR
ncbi:MAG TPA: hypothetical protein VL132_07245 [Planctomycetaceae bacterium]|nr:hypothetical protein [Planctomycetaceae bacterium]